MSACSFLLFNFRSVAVCILESNLPTSNYTKGVRPTHSAGWYPHRECCKAILRSGQHRIPYNHAAKPRCWDLDSMGTADNPSMASRWPALPPRTIRSSPQAFAIRVLRTTRPIASARMRAALRAATLVVLWVAPMAEATAEGATADATAAPQAASKRVDPNPVTTEPVAAAIPAAEAVAI